VISTIGNCAPAQMKDIVDTYVAGDREAAYAKLEALKPLMTELFTTTNPILVKESLKLLDFPVGGLRLPLIPATSAQSEHLKEVMQQVGLL
ncbi:MAG: dihydrodipicolinate synthase family protein, partial [Coriobacteriales bacterium]|nr:dihydrodipicolinate synthase family protein [Coriobacteriales bacterium]